MTQRKLTADEQELIYNLMQSLNRAALLINARGSAAEMINHIGGMFRNGTTDGLPPMPVERVPTASDIGKSVKVSDFESRNWGTRRPTLVGLDRNKKYVVQYDDGSLGSWNYCIIDQEADQ